MLMGSDNPIAATQICRHVP